MKMARFFYENTEGVKIYDVVLTTPFCQTISGFDTFFTSKVPLSIFKQFRSKIILPSKTATVQSPKSFDYHNFLRNILHADMLGNRPYIVADERNFQAGMPDYPYRNYFYGVGLACEGRRRLRVGFSEFDLPEQSLLVIGPGLIRQWLDNNHQYHHNALFFTADLFQAPVNADFLNDLPFFKANIQHVKPLQDTDFQQLAYFFNGLSQFEKEPTIVRGLALALLEKVSSLYVNDAQNPPPQYANRKQSLTRDFQDLVQKHYLEHKDVAFYAEKLNLSAKHLSETVKETTGKSAKIWIDELVLFEAKSLLKQTDMSIKEIVYWLGYDDPSYFTKIFRDTEGVTPLAYRKQ
jgi:AraC family transcriptional regulator, transcriptional activator of pobA